jgi:transposase
LEKYINKQINKYKKEDRQYIKFLKMIQSYIGDQNKYNRLRQEVEEAFYQVKDKMSCPHIRNPSIWCSSFHTIELKENSYYDWYFIVDSNEKLSAKRMRKITIPIKYSTYHHKILKDKILNNTFKIGLNKLNQIEIMATYNIEKEYTKNEIKDMVGIDIGLKKLIVSSDGEVIEQNKYILKLLGKVVKNQANRRRLEKRLQKKYNDDTFRLQNNKYIRKQNRLTRFVICDNRYRIKQFLGGREND